MQNLLKIIQKSNIDFYNDKNNYYKKTDIYILQEYISSCITPAETMN